MIDIDVTIDLTEVEKGLHGMAVNADRLRPAFNALKKPMRADQRDHSKKKEGPGGAWPQKKRLGSKSKKAKSRNRRKLLGRLPAAMVVQAEAHRIVARSLVKWSSIHQEGGTAGRGAKIPARPFLWISDALLKTAADLIADHVVGGF